MQRLWKWMAKHSRLLWRTALALVAGTLFFLDLFRGGTLRFIGPFYDRLDATLASNVLGVTAQIIGFVITLVTTGVFVAGQFMGERLPQRIIRPFLWGRTGVIPVMSLSLVLVYDIFLYILTGQKLISVEFIPLASSIVVFVGFAVVGRGCLVGLTESVRALNIQSIVDQLGGHSLNALAKRDVASTEKTVSNLLAVALFSIERNNLTVARQAIRHFLTISKKWDDKTANYMEVDCKGKGDLEKSFTDLKGHLLDGPKAIITRAIHEHNLVAFQYIVMELATALPSLSPELMGRYEKHFDWLVRYYPAFTSPEMMQVLVNASATISKKGLEGKNSDVFQAGLRMLARLWQDCSSGDEAAKSSVVRKAGELAINSLKEEDRQFRKKAIGLFSELCSLLVGTNSEALFLVWLGWYKGLLERTIELELYDELKQIVAEFTDTLYGAAVYHQFEPGYRLLPAQLFEMLPKVPDTHVKELAFTHKNPVLLARNTSNDVAMFPLVDIFTHVVQRGIQMKDPEAFRQALEVLRSVPLHPCPASNNLLAFIGECSKNVIESKLDLEAGALFDLLLDLVRSNHRTMNRSSLNFLLGQANTLLTSGCVQTEHHIRFIRFCFNTDLEVDGVSRAIMFQYLREFIQKVKDPEVLKEARLGCIRVAISAIEEQDESLVRAVSNYLGWLAYGVIAAEMRLPERVKLLSDVLGITVLMNRHARRCGLSRSTIVFLATLYAIIGAVCEEQDDTERPALLKPVIEAVRAVNDGETLKAAVEAREPYGVWIVTKGADSYARFLKDALG